MFDLKNIIGNENLILNIKRANKRKKIFHSYIISGPKNSGKLFITNCLAKFILCANNQENNNACNNCRSCHSFEGKNNPDIIYVTPSKTNFIGVDDIREQIKNKINIKPYFCEHKIFILNDADKMTIAAQNALLKILEEPPDYVIFFLLGEKKENFLMTIVSRCIILRAGRINLNEIKNYLFENYFDVERNLIEIACNYSQGNIGQAIFFLGNKDFFVLREKIIDFMFGMKKMNLAEAINFVYEIEEQKENIDFILDMIYFWYADMIYYKNGKKVERMKNIDKVDIFVRESNFYEIESLYKKLKVIEKAKRYLGYNINFRLNMIGMILDLFLD